ncbi:MAG TPA: type II secretion system protein [Pseudidiomarina sp.]|nr:type II secretion system protein [Pseudidiomarina sp.]
MRAKSGYILFELIIALTLIGSALMLFGQWLSKAPSVQPAPAKWIADTEVLLEATRQYWYVTGVPPTSIEQLQQNGFMTEITSPWGRSWTFNSANNLNDRLIALQIQAPSIAEAQWLKTQLSSVVVQHHTVSIMVWQPISEIHAARYLHRVPRTDSPELNQLHTDIDFANHDIQRVGQLDANDVNMDEIRADQLIVRNLTGTWVTVDTITTQSLNTLDGNYYQLRNQLQQLQQLWDQCVASGGCK